MASEPDSAETRNHQITVLKVSIHCEGCKRKVRRVLQELDGIHSIDIESKQNKVTVSSSSLNADSLIRRLLKHGKHAELWPKAEQIPPKTEKQQPPEEMNTSEKSACEDGKAEASRKEEKEASVSDEVTVSYSAVQPNTGNYSYLQENYCFDSYYEFMRNSGGSYDVFNDENTNSCSVM